MAICDLPSRGQPLETGVVSWSAHDGERSALGVPATMWLVGMLPRARLFSFLCGLQQQPAFVDITNFNLNDQHPSLSICAWPICAMMLAVQLCVRFDGARALEYGVCYSGLSCFRDGPQSL